MDLVWSFFQFLYAISRGLERLCLVLFYLGIAYIDRVLAYVMTNVIGFQTTTAVVTTIILNMTIDIASITNSTCDRN